MLLTVQIDDDLGQRLIDALAAEKATAPAQRQLTQYEYGKVLVATKGDPTKFEAERRKVLGLPPLTGGRPREPVSRRSIVEASLRMYLDKNHPAKKAG
jgi:hypothetical protein